MPVLFRFRSSAGANDVEDVLGGVVFRTTLEVRASTKVVDERLAVLAKFTKVDSLAALPSASSKVSARIDDD